MEWVWSGTDIPDQKSCAVEAKNLTKVLPQKHFFYPRTNTSNTI